MSSSPASLARAPAFLRSPSSYPRSSFAENFTKERPLSEFYDEVVLPALKLAEQDRQRLALTPERRTIIIETILEVIDNLNDVQEDEEKDTGKKDKTEEKNDVKREGKEVSSAPSDSAEPATGPAGTVLCLAARSGFDFAAAAMMAQLLRQRGFEARPLPAEAISLDGILSLNVDRVDFICLSFVGLTGAARAQHLVRRLRRRAPRTPIIVGPWPNKLEAAEADNLAKEFKATRVLRSFDEGMRAFAELAQRPAASRAPPTPESQVVRG
jgi:hypothetical protein